MLVVHPSSQCDVCLDVYNWSTPAKSPHAIQCGHIFCYDCLRSTNPSNCPMCRKAFNPDRIKKLHVDRASSDNAASGRTVEESELLKRVGFLFAEDAAEEDVNALVEEVQDWLRENEASMHQSLSNAVTALHQYKSLYVQRALDRETIKTLKATHERHALVKQQDLETSMQVEANLLREIGQIQATYDAQLAELRDQNARLQTELDRYTKRPNPLPRPPEISSLVTNLTRDHAGASPQSSQGGVVPLGLGVASAIPPAAAPTSQSSSGNSRARAPSVHFADPAPPKESKYVIHSDGTQLRQEKTRRRHSIVPGAPHSQRVIPPRQTDGDSDITPRPLVSLPPTASGRVRWPAHLIEFAPKPDSPCVWIGPQDVPHEILPNEVPLESLRHKYGHPAASSRPSAPQDGPSNTLPVIPPPPPGVPPIMIQTAQPATETGSARLRPAPPVIGRSPMHWRPGPAHKEGYVMAYLPAIGGLSWIPEEQAAKLPVRARGTESRNPYVIAKNPRDVDDEWRRNHDGASPGPNPLQLSGVPVAPVAPVAGPSSIGVQGEQYDALPGTSTAISTLFRNAPESTNRTIAPSASTSNTSLSAIGLLGAPANSGRATRGTARQNSTRSASDPLGLNIASLPESERSMAGRASEQPEVQPSPASSWGTIPVSSRNSSLGNLHLNNLPSPHPFARPSESLEQLPIGELNGGPIVLTDVVTPRQSSSLFADDRSMSSHSERSRDGHVGPSGLLLNPSAGSSRQVVSSVHDLEDVNRTLMQLAGSREREVQSRRSSRPSSRHSRQPSMTGDEGEAMVGPRTGITLYSSRPLTEHSSSQASGELSTDPSPLSQSRPRSGASTRSHAESTHSSHSHHSSHSVRTTQSDHSVSSHRSSDPHRRARRGSTASALDSVRDHDREREREPATWTAVPADTQPYGSSRDPYTSDSRSQKSQGSIPRAMDGLGSGPGSLSSLLLSFDPPSTSSAVTGNGEEAAGIHAPRPVSGRRSSLFGGAWNARSGR